MDFICAVDIGGTFTDCIVRDSAGHITLAKSPSTPDDFSEGFFNALAQAATQMGLTLDELLSRTRLLLHGTTVGINALLELKGAKTGLITTRGHGDALLIMRSVGRSAGLPIERLLHVSRHRKPSPLIPRSLIKEVSERIDWRGEIFLPLNRQEARQAIEELLAENVEAIAISFLWGFVNPVHEIAVREMVSQMAPDVYVTCAHELIAKPGEYERTAATAINCFIGPQMSGYIQRVQQRTRTLGYKRPFLIMQASGGVATADEIIHKPLFTIGSGPAGGLIGAHYLAGVLGHTNVIATDVGGTSFDVGIISQGRPLMASETTVNQYTFFMPRLDIESIGSGGGSIIWIDPLSQTMKVGPESAGADPGPACYGRGNLRPTITDADVVLGYYNPNNFLGGALRLDREAALQAMRTVADPLRMGVVEAAAGATQIAEFQMAELLRQMTVQRGLDPREFVVYAYGGAGGAHAAAYARELGCQTVVIPLGSIASTWSAFGIQSADILHVYETSELLIAPFDVERLNRIFCQLESRAREQLREDQIPDDRIELQRFVEMKFRLQIHRIEIPVPGGTLTDRDMEALEATFVQTYEALYGQGSAFTEAGMEIGVVRVMARGKMDIPPINPPERLAREAFVGRREVYWREYNGHRSTAIYDGTRLQPHTIIEGPAIVEMPVTTIVVRPYTVGRMDAYGNFVIEL